MQTWADMLKKKKNDSIRTLWANKQIQQTCRIQNQHIGISCISKHFQWTSQKQIKKKTIPFTIASKE